MTHNNYCIAECEINKIGSDFRKLKTVLVFSDGRKFTVPHEVEIINSNKVRFIMDIRGIDTDKIVGALWEDEKGETRNAR